jgi:hypothetical protein
MWTERIIDDGAGGENSMVTAEERDRKSGEDLVVIRRASSSPIPDILARIVPSGMGEDLLPRATWQEQRGARVPVKGNKLKSSSLCRIASPPMINISAI